MSILGGPPRFRTPRCAVASPGPIAIKVEREGCQRGVPGTLVELSRGGLRIGVSEPIRRGEKIAIVLDVKGIDLRIETEALVCWTQPSHKEGWLICCALSEKITDEVFSDLAVQSILNRRTDTRRDVSFRADARSELNAEFAPLQIVNCSAFGFGALAACQLAEPGERLMLRIPVGEKEVPKVIRAKVTWSREVDRGYALGGSFLTREDCAQIQEMIDPGSRQRWLKGLSRHRPTRWGAVAVGVLLMLLIQTSAMLLQHRDAVERCVQTAGPLTQSLRDYLLSPPSGTRRGGTP